MIIKFNFVYSDQSSNETIYGTLKITQLEGVMTPIYDVIINSENDEVDTFALFNIALQQYVESRVYELFSQSRNLNLFYTKEDYKDIIGREVPSFVVDRVLDNMTNLIEDVEVRQAS
ncbi:hypothetical protein [Flammeovirga sp. SJP92]|uniref:hypothetical protein n=1 Tax=Flammeovirga sp. SJP92 TaxID=1775430 RepID=UPI0007879989|nr:hypothetical protein [Flammeovirga sp. SJP92]KXX69980.1 hypothetical protein AVL50_13975 [Flammeovirga sp. SJP92]